MRKNRWTTCFAVRCLVGAATIAPLTAQEPDPDLAAALQPLRDAFSTAYVEGRFADMAAAYTPEAVLLPSGGVVRGREAIQRFFTYGPGRTQVAHSMTPTQVTRHGPDVAVEVGVWSSTSRRGDGPANTASGRHILVWERQAGGDWLIAYDAWHGPPANRPEPQLIQDGTISSPERHETWPAVDPVDGSLWFSVVEGGFDDQRIVRAPRAGDAWGEPRPVPFSDGRFGDRAPRFSADGSQLFFTSNRPIETWPEGDLNVWVVRRTVDGWGEPTRLPEPVNTPAVDMHASTTRMGDLVLSTRREGTVGRSDLVWIPREGEEYGRAVPLEEVNDELSQSDVLVAPDGSWLIVVVTDHPLGLGGDDLYLVRRTAHGWAPLEHLPAPINSPEYEYGPSLSPDGRWLWFTSHRRGTADVYRTPLAAIGLDPTR